jgi:hypothetical protein
VDNGFAVDIYTVRFYNNGVAHYFTVDTELPVGGYYYNRPVGGPGAVNGSPNPVLWVALAEKAYVEANAYGIVTTQHVGLDSYAALDYGDPLWALRAITGNPDSDYSINPLSVDSAWNAGKLVVLCTSNPVSSYIVGNHCYAVVNYDPSRSLPFEVMNPWGTDVNGWAPGWSGTRYGLFIANAGFLLQNFPWEFFGFVAAAGGQQGHDGSNSQEMTDLVFIEDLLDAHSKSPSGSDAILLRGFACL